MKRHQHTQDKLNSVDWKSEQWQTKDPRLRTLDEPSDKCNYLADNHQMGSGI
jgi:hypothetical protein